MHTSTYGIPDYSPCKEDIGIDIFCIWEYCRENFSEIFLKTLITMFSSSLDFGEFIILLKVNTIWSADPFWNKSVNNLNHGLRSSSQPFKYRNISAAVFNWSFVTFLEMTVDELMFNSFWISWTWDWITDST